MTLAMSPISATDQDLLTQVRSGDMSAYAELWNRHSGAVTAILRLETRLDADDLTAEVFTRILAAIRSGNGPDTAFRPYALVAARNLAAEWGKRSRREIPVAEESLDAASDEPPVEDRVIVLPHRHAAARVFSSLPVRWQEVLWYLDVEQLSVAETAPLVGLNPNSTTQLAFRAREGFRQAWIQEHLSARPPRTTDCGWVDGRVGRHVRGKLAVVERGKFERHVAGCERCTALVDEGRSVESRAIFTVLPLILLGGAASGYIAAAANGQTGRSDVAAPGQPVPSATLAARYAKQSHAVRRQGRRLGRSASRSAASSRVAVASSAGGLVLAVVVAVAIIIGAQSSVEPIQVAQAEARAVASGLTAASGVPQRSPVPTLSTIAPEAPAAERPPLDGDRTPTGDAPGASQGIPAPASPSTPASAAVVAPVTSAMAIPEGQASPHVIGTGIPGASIELVVDQSGLGISLTATADSVGAFKIDVVTPGLVGDQWAVARQIVDGIASAWLAPFKVTIPSPPDVVWAWASPGKFKILTNAVVVSHDIEVTVDGVVVATFIPTAASGETFPVTTASLNPVVSVRYATGLDPSPVLIVPQV